MKVYVILISAAIGITFAGKLGHEHRGARRKPLESQKSIQYPKNNHIYRNKIILNAAIQFDEHNAIFNTSKVLGHGPFLNKGENGVFHIESGYLTRLTGEQLKLESGTIYQTILPSDIVSIYTALAKAGFTLDEFIQQTGDISHHEEFREITSGTLLIGGSSKNIKYGVIRIISSKLLISKPN